MQHVLQYLLPSILGDFIQGIDKKRIRTNFFTGKISLKEVSLNPDLVAHLGYPIRHVYSFIGNLEVRIPWVKKLKEPIEIVLDDLFLLVEPTEKMDDFDIIEERIKFLNKLTKECITKLKNLEKEKYKRGEPAPYYRILILDNFRLTIKNVHIRLENKPKGFSAGLTLAEIKLQTINEKGEEEFLDRTIEENKNKDLNKRIDVKDLAFYWNSKETASAFLRNNEYSDDEKKKSLKKGILRVGKLEGATPILMISLESNLKVKNMNKDYDDAEVPRYKLDLEFKPFNLIINHEQINQAVGLIEDFTAVIQNRKSKYETTFPTKEELAHETKAYKTVLKKILLNNESSDINWEQEIKGSKKKEEAEILKRGLLRLPNEVLIEASKKAILKTEKKKMLLRMGKKGKEGGLLGFFKRKGSQEPESLEEIIKLEEFFDSIIEENALFNDKCGTKGIIAQINVNMPVACVKLIYEKSQMELVAAFRNTALFFELSKTEEGEIQQFNFAIQGINISQTEQDIIFPILQKLENNENFKIFNISFTKKTLKESQHYTIKGGIQSIEFTFLPSFVIFLQKFINTTTNNLYRTSINDYALEKISDISKKVKQERERFIDRLSEYCVSITFSPSTILLPLEALKGEDSDCWVLGFGLSKIYTDTNIESESRNVNACNVDLNNLNVKYFDSLTTYRKSFKEEIKEENKIFSLISETSCGAKLKVMSIQQGSMEKEDTQITLSLSVGQVSIDLNPKIYARILAVKRCFDFSQEQELKEYLEVERQMIMKNCDALFKVFYKKKYEISNKWSQYIMVCSGLSLYLFKDPKDLRPAKHFLIKNATVNRASSHFEAENILIIKNKFEELRLAMETEKDIQKLEGLILKKNEDFIRTHLIATVNNTDLSDLSTEEDPDESKVSSSLALAEESYKMTFSLKLQGVALRLFNEELTLTNEVILKSFSLKTVPQDFCDTMNFSIKELTILDYYAKKEKETVRVLLTNKQLTKATTEEEDYIKFERISYTEAHPHFTQLSAEKEFSITANSLKINWIPDRIIYLINFFSKPISVYCEHKPASSPSINKQHFAKKNENNQLIKFYNANIKINNLSLTLVTRTSWLSLGLISLENINLGISSDKNSTSYKATFGGARILDLTGYQQDPHASQTPTPILVSCDKDKTCLKFSLESREKEYLAEIKSDKRSILSLEFDSVKLNLMLEPLSRIICYIFDYLLSFGITFGVNLEQRIEMAKSYLNPPRFTDFNLKVINSKLTFKPKPASKVHFELDFESINLHNEVTPNTSRILKEIPGLGNIHTETLHFEFSETKLVKVAEDKQKIELTQPFKLDILYESCPLFDEYLFASNIDRAKKYEYLDNTLTINCIISPVVLKISHEDYLDLMDCNMMNFAYVDKKESIYTLPLPVDPKIVVGHLPIPVNMTLAFDDFTVLLTDQERPLVRIIALSPHIRLKQDRSYEKCIELSFEQLYGSYFWIENKILMEKMLFGPKYIERPVQPLAIIEPCDAVLDPSVLHSVKSELYLMNSNTLQLNILGNAAGDIDVQVNFDSLKLFLKPLVIMRMGDFFLYGEPLNRDEFENLKDPKVKLNVNIKDAEVAIESNSHSSMILRGAVNAKIEKFLFNPFNLKKEFTTFTTIRAELQGAELLVINEAYQVGKGTYFSTRRITTPFTLDLSLDQSIGNDAYKDSFFFKLNDEIIPVKLCAEDLIVFKTAIKKILKDLEDYRTKETYPVISKYTDYDRRIQLLDTKRRKYISEIMFFFKKLQMRYIKDFNEIPVPIFQVNFHNTETLYLEETPEKIRGDGALEVDSAYYNSAVDAWEPITELWSFKFKFEIGQGNQLSKAFNLTAENQPLNVNISHDLVEVLVKVFQNWNVSKKSFKELSESQMDPLDKSNRLLEILNNYKETEAQDISHYTICNDLGYPIQVSSVIAGIQAKDIVVNKNLYVKNGEHKDLLLEWNRGGLEAALLNIKIDYPGYEDVIVDSFDITEYGASKKSAYVKNLDTFSILCTTINKHNKKFIKLSSPIIIENTLNVPVFIKINEETASKYTIHTIYPHTTFSIPFDKYQHFVSFLSEEDPTNYEVPVFLARSLGAVESREIKIGKFCILVKSQRTKLHDIVTILPPLVIKNSLPFPVLAQVRGFINALPLTLNYNLAAQEEVQILQFDGKSQVTMTLATEKFKSNEYILQPSPPNQELFFKTSKTTCKLRVYSQSVKPGKINFYSIVAETVVFNCTDEKLAFYGAISNAFTESPFSTVVNGQEVAIFDDIQSLRIRSNSNGSISGAIHLTNCDNIYSSLYLREEKTSDISVRVENVSFDPSNNTYTRIVYVSPRFVFFNNTRYTIEIIEHRGDGREVRVKPGERIPLKFIRILNENGFFMGQSKKSKIRIKICPEKDPLVDEWKESGLLTLSLDGSKQFLCQSIDGKEIKVFNLDISIDKNMSFFTLEELKDTEVPIQIENQTDDLTLILSQDGVKHFDLVIDPNEKLPFAWIEPKLPQKLRVKVSLLNVLSQEQVISIEQLTQSSLQFMVQGLQIELFYSVMAKNGKRILKFYTSGSLKEQPPERYSSFLMTFVLKGVGISLISTATYKRYELFYVYLNSTLLVYSDLNDSVHLEAKIKDIKIDNNITQDTKYPILLYSEKPKDFLEAPFLEFKLKTQKQDSGVSIKCIRELIVKLSNIVICMDGKTPQAIKSYIDNMNKILESRASPIVSWKDKQPRKLVPEYIFIETCLIQPFTLTLNINIKLEDLLPFAPRFLSSFLTTLTLHQNYIRLQNNKMRFGGLKLNQLFNKKSNLKLIVYVGLQDVSVNVGAKDPDFDDMNSPMAIEFEGLTRLAADISMNHVHREDLKDYDAEQKVSRLPRVFYGCDRIYKPYSELEAKVYKLIKEKGLGSHLAYAFLDCVFFRHTFAWQTSEPTRNNACLWITTEKLLLVELDELTITDSVDTNKINSIQMNGSAVNVDFTNGDFLDLSCPDEEIREIIVSKLTLLKEGNKDYVVVAWTDADLALNIY